MLQVNRISLGEKRAFIHNQQKYASFDKKM